MRRVFMPALAALLAVSMLGCTTETKTSKSTSSDDAQKTDVENGADGEAPEVDVSSEEAAVREAVERHFEAYEEEDLSGVAATVDDSIETQMLDSARATFEDYDMTYDLENVVVEIISPTEAEVSLYQTTRKVAGPPFRDNRVGAIHYLRKVDGSWVIYKSQILDVEYLD